MNKKPILEPCKVCGCADAFDVFVQEGGRRTPNPWWEVVCCVCDVAIKPFDTKEDAAQWWNTVMRCGMR